MAFRHAGSGAANCRWYLFTGGTGNGVDIYIVDSGINFDHMEFENRAFYAGVDFVDEYLNTVYKGRDCNGHGTHVASLAAGRTIGVAKKATLHSLRVLDCKKMGKESSVLKALDFVAKARIKNYNQSIVVVMSLIGFKSFLLNSAVEHAVKQGIVVVTAAGNDRKNSCDFSPGSSPFSINVAASDYYNFPYQLGQFGTNYGKCVDIFAPGVKVNGASHLNKNGYTMLSGTSMACPLVAGAAAILLQHFPMLSPGMIKDALIHTSAKDKIDLTKFQSALQGTTPNRLLHINATTIATIGKYLHQTSSVTVEKAKSASNTSNAVEVHPTKDRTGKLHVTIETTDKAKNQSDPIPIKQQESSTTQPIIPEALPDPIKMNLKERSVEPMAQKMWKKNYTIQYMNYAITGNNRTYFTIIYNYNPEVEDYRIQCSLPYKDTRAIFNAAAFRNQVVYLLVPYLVNNLEQYCVGLKKRKSGEPKVLHTIGLNPAEADQLYRTYTLFNYNLASERYIVINDKVKATLIYAYTIPTHGYSVRRYKDLSFSVLMNKVVEGQRSGYHIKDMSNYTLNGKTNFSLLLATNSSGSRYKWFLRSKRRMREALKINRNNGFYPSAVLSIRFGHSEPYYLVSLSSSI